MSFYRIKEDFYHFSQGYLIDTHDSHEEMILGLLIETGRAEYLELEEYEKLVLLEENKGRIIE